MHRIPCPCCAKKFRTESGLRWHLFHVHKWRDVDELLKEPEPFRLANIAMLREIALAAFAKEIGSDVQTMNNLIAKHYGKDDGGPSPR